MQHLRQEATHHTSRVAALVVLAAAVACALAFAVTGALAANPPDTSISAGPSGTYRSGSAQFTLGASTGGVSYECSLDGAAFEPCSSSPSYEVANGSHRLEARATSVQGTDATPAVRTWWADASFQNGNFETATAGWTSQGFTVPGFGWSGGTLQVVDGGLSGGKKMGRFTASGSGSPTISTSPDPVNASPVGVTYTARGSIRGMTSGRTICLKLREYQEGESSDTLVGSGQQCVTTNGSWQTLPTLTYTSQQAGSYIDALVFQTVAGTAGEIFYVDGLSVSEPGSPTVPALPEVQGDPVLLGLGDIASCWANGDEATARLLDTTPGVIGIAGDTEQNHGEPGEFQGCYDPPWGRHKWRTKPAVGDHEYGTTGAAGYFSYFGSAAGQSGKGWYSYDLGSWHLVVLNSNCELIGGCGPGSEQYEWLQQDLAANAGSCVGAYWHHPRWSAGATHGSLTKSAPFWELLYEYGAEFVYSGNDHTYQRFAPQTPDGQVDNERGMRQFVVGEGGTQHYPLNAPLANTQVQNTGTFGVLKLTLHPGSYEWKFLPQAGRSFTDSGTTSCSPLDKTAPDTAIDSGPSGPTASAAASFGFSSEAGATFECKLDDGAWQTCTSPRALSGLAQGEHSFRVRATDAAGNTDASEAVRTWTVDTVAPDTAIGTGPSGLTASTSASIGFSSEAGATFECKLDSGAWQACTSPRTLTGLAQGDHSFRVRATDAAGNTDATEATRTWSVDSVAPDTTIGTGPSGPTASTMASIGFDSDDDDATFECKLDSGAWQACTPPRTLTGLAQGDHTFRVRAADAAGNIDATEAARTWSVDTVAPDTTIGSGPSGPTASAAASFAFSSSETGSTFECRLDSGAWQSCTSPRALTGLPQGAHSFRVRATDAAGNVDASEGVRTWTVDTVAPETTIESGPSGMVASASASVGFDSDDDAATFECKLDSGAWQSCTSPRALSGLADGGHTFRVRATDAAGNADATEAARTWTVDTVAPNTTIAGGPAALVATGSASLTFSSSETGSSFECRLDAGAWHACASPEALAGLADGSHSFRVRATDAAGNVDASEATRTWTVDTTAPETAIGSGPSGPTASTSASIGFSSEAGATFECKLDEGAWQSCTSPRALTGLPQGAHSFRVRASDAAGNVDASEAVRTWTVDTVAPETVLQSGPSGSSASRNATFTFDSPDASAGFECKLDDAAWEACDSPRQLTGAADGPHTFRVRAVDAAGNRDASEAARPWTVDTNAPDTTLSGGPSGSVSATTAAFTFASSEGGATFECRLDAGAWEACSSPRTLTGLGDGSHTFRVRALDAAGNADASEAVRTWTVDTVAPETTIDSGPTGPTASTSATLAFSSNETGSSFECKLDSGAWQACTAPRTLTGLAQGEHTLRVRATDAAGNVDASEAARTWIADTVEPDTTFDSAPEATTASNRAEFAFGSGEAGAGFECRLDDGAWQDCTSPHVLTGLANGAHDFRARAHDAAGNLDQTPAEHSWTVDAEPPDTTITGGPAGTVRTTGAGFSFAASEPGTGFECRLDAAAWRACTSPHNLSGLALGRHTFAVRAVDTLGNADPSEATRSWTIERVPPIVKPPVDGGNQPPTTPAAPSMKLITGRLAGDVAGGARTLRKLGARRLLKRRALTVPGIRALAAGTFTAKLTARKGGRTILVARGTGRARAAGPVALRLRLTRAGQAVLAAKRPPKLRLAIEFRDTSGRAALRVASLRLPG